MVKITLSNKQSTTKIKFNKILVKSDKKSRDGKVLACLGSVTRTTSFVPKSCTNLILDSSQFSAWSSVGIVLNKSTKKLLFLGTVT
jgi:ribosomal protein S16